MPIRIFELSNNNKKLLKETDGKSIIKIVKENEKLIKSLTGSISSMLGGSTKEGMVDLFTLLKYMEDAKEVYIIIEKEK